MASVITRVTVRASSLARASRARAFRTTADIHGMRSFRTPSSTCTICAWASASWPRASASCTCPIRAVARAKRSSAAPQTSVAQRRQRNYGDAIAELACQLLGRGKGEPCLPDTAWPNQRHESCIACFDHVDDRPKFGLAPDQRRQCDRRLMPLTAWRNQLLQIRALLRVELERRGQGMDHMWVGTLAVAPLERTDRVVAETSPLRELLLRQAGGFTKAAKRIAEWLAAHRHRGQV